MLGTLEDGLACGLNPQINLKNITQEKTLELSKVNELSEKDVFLF